MYKLAAPIVMACLLLAAAPLARANSPATQPTASPESQRLTIEYSGPVRVNPYAPAPQASTDPGARAATWRYYYSPPIWCGYYNGYAYGGWYGGCGWYGGGYRGGGRYWISAAWNGGY